MYDGGSEYVDADHAAEFANVDGECHVSHDSRVKWVSFVYYIGCGGNADRCAGYVGGGQ